jgi:polyhydroxyalkanoate synthesis regulator phasin
MFSSLNIFAEDTDKFSLILEKKQIEVMVKRMVKSGRMTPEEAAHTKREISSIGAPEVENLSVQNLKENFNDKLAKNK